MFTQKCIGAAALTLTLVTWLAADPASATPFNKCRTAAHFASCPSSDPLSGHGVNSGRTFTHRYVSPRSQPLYPYYGDYLFQHEPPFTTNGPYYGYEPYNGFQSSLGFSF